MRFFAPEAMVRVLTKRASNLFTQVLMEAMENCHKFWDQRGHFEDWVEKREGRLQVVTGNNNGYTLLDQYVTEILLLKIYEASAMELLMKRKQDPKRS